MVVVVLVLQHPVAMQVPGVGRTAMEALTCKESTRAALTGCTVPAVSPQTPLLNRVYWYRMRVMQKLTRAALHTCRQRQMGKGERPQLVVLGCGYDSAYQSVDDDQEFSVATFLVDLPTVMEKRISLNICSDSKATLIMADLNEPMQVVNKLIKSGLDQSKPTVVLLECVLCYLSKEKVSKLLQHISSSLDDAVVITYDPLVDLEGQWAAETTDTNFSKMLLHKFMERGVPIRFSCGSKYNHRRIFESCGLKYNIEYTINEAVSTLLTSEERSVYPEAEPFDEYASLAMLGNSYIVSVSSLYSNALSSLLQHLSDSLATPQSKDTIAAIVSRFQTEDTIIPLSPIQQTRGDEILGVREGKASDEKAIKSLLEECFSEIRIKYKEVRKFLKKSLSRLIQDIAPATSISKFWVITTPLGDIVGSVGLRANPNPHKCHLEIIHLGVSPLYRTRGVGHFLLQIVLNYARSSVMTAKYNTIELSVVKDLQAAVSLYKSIGFIETNSVDIGNSCHIIYMCLKL